MENVETSSNQYPKVLKYIWLIARIVLLIIVIGGITLGLAYLVPMDKIPAEYRWLASHLISLTAGFIGIYIFRRFADRKSFVSIGFSLSREPRSFLAGSGIAIAVLLSGFGILLLMGAVGIESVQADARHLITTFLMFVCVSVFEEMLLRGYVLNNMMDVMNKYLALVLSSLLFSALHLLNPGMSVIAFINLFLAGMLLGAAYIFTRNLWLPIGMHLFWNYVQGPVLGFSVSGTSTGGQTLLTLSKHKSDLLNGGSFGFEGSVVCSVLCVMATAAIIMYCIKYCKPPKEVAGEDTENTTVIEPE